MFFLEMFERRTNWDYRDYRDYRTRLKRRLRRRLSIGSTLLACVLLAVGLGGVRSGVWAFTLPIEAAPVLPAPIRLQGPDDPAANREIQQLMPLANTPG